MEDQSTIRVKVRRGQGDGLAEYEVPVEDGMSVFNVLERIRNDIDPTLAFLISCRHNRRQPLAVCVAATRTRGQRWRNSAIPRMVYADGLPWPKIDAVRV